MSQTPNLKIHSSLLPAPSQKLTHNIISFLDKVQFVCEFFILSKLHENHEAIPELLMVLEALKFYFKAIALARSPGLYL
jgi:hypothetical protein